MGVVPYPFLGGVFNAPDPFFRIQVYFWIILALLFALGMTEVIPRVMFWQPLAPFQGLWKAFKTRTNAAFMFDEKLNWSLTSEAGAKLIFDASDYDIIEGKLNRFRAWLSGADFSVQVAKKLQGDWEEAPLVTIGRTPTDLVFDAHHWTYTESREREEIVKVVEEYNPDHPEDEIHTLSKAYRYAIEGKIKLPDNIKLKIKIPWARIDGAFPKLRNDAAWAGFLRSLARKLRENEQMPLNKYALYLMLFFLGIYALMVIMYFWRHR